MHDRGMIKWQPFNSVISSRSIINKVLDEKEKIKRPNLSEDQLIEIEKLIKESFTNEEEIEISFYKSGKIYIKQCFVKYIIIDCSKVILNDNSSLFFNQIINIKKV